MTLAQDKTAFLATTHCVGWDMRPLAGDASSRSYHRLYGADGRTAILMDAGPDAAMTVPPFLSIARHLSALGLCPPEVLARSADGGFVLLADLGPTDFARHLAAHPQDEAVLYHAAVDVLLTLARSAPPEGLTRLTPDLGAEMLAPLFEWFATSLSDGDRQAIEAAVKEALATHAEPPETLSLRDFHAENLIWRPDRTGTDRVGVLDFQDAFVAPAPYDLVSLLRDARRDVAEATRAQAMAQFADGIGQPLARVEAACAVLGVQRNLRILGVFSRLAKRDGKDRYRPLIPRVLAHVEADLTHPAAEDLRRTLAPVMEAVRT